MLFTVLRATARGNLLLESPERQPVAESLPVFFEGQRAAVVFETIASVKRPRYLARPSRPAVELVGKTLESR